ncbi:HAD family hydrolase [Lactococcus nasutitermitis]|uniref:HAD family hydrolase n=1 Tax=Lactococcus nasutitermitis TaxID=1652957 RepID=A0ABV9JB28_9LACT|nr:HAD family phosphatase [Lactococcus nasutitermitis]
MSKFKAIIFDMDGVLVDTESYYAGRREEFFGSQQIDISHLKNKDFIGGNMKDIWPKILQNNFTAEKAQKLQEDYTDYKNRTPLPYAKLLFPDVIEILDYLHKHDYKIALASSSSMTDIQLMLNTHQLGHYFDLLLSGADFKQSKPNPEIYQVAMQRLQVTADESLIIEDSENGIAAGKAAGATVWAIKDTRFGMNQKAADAFVNNLHEALQAIQAQEK